MRFTTTLLTASSAIIVAAHPGANVQEEAMERRDFLTTTKRTSLDHCAAQLKARGLEKAAAIRRHTMAQAKAKRGVVARAEGDINKSHLSNAKYDTSTPLGTLFEQEKSCVLAPEATEGPYYVAGEFVRRNLVEQEKGVPLAIDLGIFDVDTCEPVTNTYVEIWSCNATGVYSGVPSGADYASAPENVNTTFLRGLQRTDASGAVQFETLYPGHYTGRTQHVHVAVHPSATEKANQTVLDTTVSHVGQMYFDQSLSALVEAVAPYNTNTQAVTTNTEDAILSQDLPYTDPFVSYILLGEDVSEGILAWYSFGVNMTASREVSVAATYYESGGVANADSIGPPGPN